MITFALVKVKFIHYNVIQLLHTTADCTIQYDTARNWLLVTWLGAQLARTAQARCTDILAHARVTGCIKMLNDGSQDEAGWQELTPWVARVFLPQLAAEGVVAVAWVIPRNLRARISMNEVLAAVTKPSVATFEDLEDAYAWLSHATKPAS